MSSEESKNSTPHKKIAIPATAFLSDPPSPEEIADAVDDWVRELEIMAYFRARLSEYANKLCKYNKARDARKKEKDNGLQAILNNKLLQNKEAGPPGEGWHWDTGFRDIKDEQGICREKEVSGWLPPSTIEMCSNPYPWNGGDRSELSSADQAKRVLAGYWLLALCHDYYLLGKRSPIIDKAFADGNPEIAEWWILQNPNSKYHYRHAIHQHENYIYPALKDVHCDLEKWVRITETKQSTKKRGKTILNQQVQELLKSSPVNITAETLAEILNRNYAGVYNPTSASAVGKTESWKQRSQKK